MVDRFFLQKCVQMLQRRRNEITEAPVSRCFVQNIMIVDRNVDLVTPLVTQLTYEGLIDELFTVSCGNFNHVINLA